VLTASAPRFEEIEADPDAVSDRDELLLVGAGISRRIHRPLRPVIAE
jgi:hypothetical protein